MLVGDLNDSVGQVVVCGVIFPLGLSLSVRAAVIGPRELLFPLRPFSTCHPPPTLHSPCSVLILPSRLGKMRRGGK